MTRLTSYDRACGKRIDAAFATYQGLDPSATMWIVFAALVHRLTAGVDAGGHNPLLVEGAGWVGYIGHGARVALFDTLADGCRAAGVTLQFPEFRAVQTAYRAGDPFVLARSLEASPLQHSKLLAGLADEVAWLTRRRRIVETFTATNLLARLLGRKDLSPPERRLS
jgi:hypothetical protein